MISVGLTTANQFILTLSDQKVQKNNISVKNVSNRIAAVNLSSVGDLSSLFRGRFLMFLMSRQLISRNGPESISAVHQSVLRRPC